ncbi:MAG: alpha/beta fold hydrolase [Oleispira sp.]
MTKILSVGLIVLSLLLSGCSSLTSLFFYPQKQYLRTPADINLAYEEVNVQTSDGTELASWFLPASNESQNKKSTIDSPIVLFLHGNAENISTHIGSVYWLPENGVNVFLLDYRGYGHSEGEPFIPAIFQDVEASLIWLRQRFPQRKIYIFGQSIGSAIATTSMALFKDEYDIAGLILDSSFTGYRDIAQHVTTSSLWTWVVWPFTWLLPTQWDPVNYIAQVSPRPILMFHSQADGVLPYALGRELYEQAKKPKVWQESKGGHIQTFNFKEYREILLHFLTD